MEPWVIGPLTVYPYGLVIALAAVPALWWLHRNTVRAGLKAGTSSWLAVWMIPLAFLLSRAGYCLLIIDEILGLEEPELIFHVQDGGFLLWGAMAGGMLAMALTARVTGQTFGRIADCMIGPFCLMLVAGRIAGGLLAEQGLGLDLGSWFSPDEADFTARFSLFRLQGYGFLERFPFAVRNYYDEWCWAIFMLEAVYAILIGVLTLRTHARTGGRFMLLILLYACGQVLWEAMLRGEVVHLPYLGFVRANQVLCAIAIVAVWGVCIHRMPEKGRRKKALLSFLQILAGGLIVVAMEFAAFEKKITLIAWAPADVCHLVMAGGCVCILLAVLPLWRRVYQTE